MPSILVVDDDRAIGSLLARWLTDAGHSVVTAETAEAALEITSLCPPAIVISDIQMPVHDGFWLAVQVRRRWPDTAVILITGNPEWQGAATGIKLGVIDYLSKPFSRPDVLATIQRALAWRDRQTDLRQQQSTLQMRIAEQQDTLNQALEDLQVNSLAAVDALLRISTLRDPETYRHARRVGTVARLLAQRLGLDARATQALECGALLHDIGKIGISDRVLSKAGPLSDDERSLVRHHPELGYEVLKRVPYLMEAAEIVLASHEAWNGSGYPRGLSGREIPIGARILTVADAFDALTHNRVYRRGLDVPSALSELERCSGTQFDPTIVALLVRHVQEITHSEHPVPSESRAGEPAPRD